MSGLPTFVEAAGRPALAPSGPERATRGPSNRLGRTALPLLASDAALQGARYAFIVYLGYRSLPLLGSFLIGAAWGAFLGVLTDFGISQHWLRSAGAASLPTRHMFFSVIRGKLLFSLLGVLMLVLLARAGIGNITAPVAMATGLLLMATQSFGDTCEAVSLSQSRYATVSRFRGLMTLGGYVVPLAYGVWVGQNDSIKGVVTTLGLAAVAGVLVSSLYVWNVGCTMRGDAQGGAGYREIWWGARWLGLNQLAIVIDVRAPLIMLGLMLGETAVGLYGLVQRTTAIVELAWASLARLLLTSYAELGVREQVQEIRTEVMRAGRLTGLIMAALAACIWAGVFFVLGRGNLSTEAALALVLLKWGSLAIALSSFKRPFVLGLIALYHERAVCRVNGLSAAAGLLLVPAGIIYLGIWGPVAAWVVLEAAACIVIVHLFLAMTRRVQAKAEPPLSQRAAL